MYGFHKISTLKVIVDAILSALAPQAIVCRPINPHVSRLSTTVVVAK